MENTDENCEMIWKIWKKSKLKCEMNWKIQKKIPIRQGKYGRKKKNKLNMNIYRKYGRKVS